MSGRVLLALVLLSVGCLPSEELKSYSDGPAPPTNASEPVSGAPESMAEGAPSPSAAPSNPEPTSPNDGELPASPTALDPAQPAPSGSSAPADPPPAADGPADEALMPAQSPDAATPAAGATDAPPITPSPPVTAAPPVNPAPPVTPSPPVETQVRFVRLIADSSVQSPYTSIAEFNVLDASGQVVDRSGWVASADSEETVFMGGARAALAIDGAAASVWHTAWFQENPPPGLPHTFEVDMGVPHQVSGFRYLGRQDDSLDGRIADYRFFVSADGVEWGEPVASGTLQNTTAEQEVRLP
jgi:F5/8 type C domain